MIHCEQVFRACKAVWLSSFVLIVGACQSNDGDAPHSAATSGAGASIDSGSASAGTGGSAGSAATAGGSPGNTTGGASSSSSGPTGGTPAASGGDAASGGTNETGSAGSSGSGGKTDVGASGGSGEAGAGASGAGGMATGTRRRGKSVGCGMAASAGGNQTLSIPECTGCTAAMGNCPRDCIAPEFAPRAGGNIDFTTRSFSVQLPAGYASNTAYPVYLGGGGCGTAGDGLSIPGVTGIKVNLAIKNGGSLDGTCFADGGQACSGNTTSLSWCVNSPEVPYIRGILSWIETHYCVDLDEEFIGGSSSGAWEAYTLGCGDADQLRGFFAIAGGKREHRWPCTGPAAAFMIVDKGDTSNPIVVNTVEPHLDSHGSSAARDELLIRNGCVSSASTAYDSKYPSCLKYTGCPAAYPVVWCELSGGHTNTNEGGVNYAQAIWPFFLSLPPSP